MPWQELATFLSYGVMAIGGWILKSIWTAVRELQIDLSKLREEIGKDYMPRIEIKELFDNILYEIREVKHELKAHESREFAWHKQTVAEVRNASEK
jgi:hypothetical protein